MNERSFWVCSLEDYVGDLYQEKKHGKGVLRWPDGRSYTGAFFADRRHGFGIFRNPDRSEFQVRSVA
jgi:hypothetical protein